MRAAAAVLAFHLLAFLWFLLLVHSAQARWDLKLQEGGSVSWEGGSGEEAAERYVDAHQDATVLAFRPSREPEVRPWPWGDVVG